MNLILVLLVLILLCGCGYGFMVGGFSSPYGLDIGGGLALTFSVLVILLVVRGIWTSAARRSEH